MLSRRDILGSLAGLPFVGFLFGKREEYLLSPGQPIKAKVVEELGKRPIYIHVPCKGEMSMAIPLGKDIQLSSREEKNGVVYLKDLNIVDGKIISFTERSFSPMFKNTKTNQVELQDQTRSV